MDSLNPADAQCFRIPAGAAFHRRQYGDEWVIYHTGTGETMRLSEAAITVLDLLDESGPSPLDSLAARLNDLVDPPLPAEELHSVLRGLLDQLLGHECIESLPCG